MKTEEVADRWKFVVDRYLPDVPDSCAECDRKQKTGDVMLVFGQGDLTLAVVKKTFLCDRCGYMAIASGTKPAATMVYIEPEDAKKRFSKLGFEKVARVREAFEIVDRIHDHIAQLLVRLHGLTTPPPNEVPS